MRRIDLQRRIVERQRALVASAAGREIAARKEPARPGRQVLLNLVAAGAAVRQRRLDVGRRRRQLRPAIHGLARRIPGVRLVDHHPDVIGKAAGDAFLRREPANRRRGIAERDAVLVVPRDVEGLAVPFEPERPSAFARHDAKTLRLRRASLIRFERRQLQSRLAGVGVELERSGADDRVIGDQLRGFEIPLDALVLHELHVAEVREPLAADRVARRVDADLDVDAGQIANRIGVLGTGQPPDGHASGLAGVRGFVGFHGRSDPRRRRLALGVRRLLGRLERRHHAGLEHVGNLLPILEMLADRELPDQLLDAEASLGLLGAVALEAVLLESRGRCRRGDATPWRGSLGLSRQH